MSYKWKPADPNDLFKMRPGEKISDIDKYIETLKMYGYDVNEEDMVLSSRGVIDGKK